MEVVKLKQNFCIQRRGNLQVHLPNKQRNWTAFVLNMDFYGFRTISQCDKQNVDKC